jgi:hypothetical protein
MKLTIHDIKKETCKLLANYFGFGTDNVVRKNESKPARTNMQTPDFYDSRVNNLSRKNLSTNKRPE